MIQAIESTVEALFGDDAELSCLVQSYPAPLMQWYNDRYKYIASLSRNKDFIYNQVRDLCLF